MRVKKDGFINSYGLIIFCIKNGIPYFLIQQRRDTFDYFDFLFGKWNDEIQVEKMLQYMSNEEKERLLKYSFDELWDDLLLNKNSKIFKVNYHKAKAKFESVKSSLPFLIRKNENSAIEPPWEFPKGRKEFENETDITCALREFREETRLFDLNLRIKNNNPYIEKIIGTDERVYCTYYYLAECFEMVEPVYKEIVSGIRKRSISDEVENLQWTDIQGTFNKLSIWKIDTLKKITKYLFN